MFEAAPGMTAELRGELAAALDRFTIHSSWSFQVDDEPLVDVRLGSAAPMQVGDDAPLIQAIQMAFYNRCYARRPATAAAVSAADPEFIRRLTAANTSRDGWDKGWVVHQFGANGQVFVRKGERERMGVPGAFLSEAMVGTAPQPGASVSLRVPRETFDVQPGYYFAFGETLDELADQLSMVRVYFNCRAGGAPSLFAELTSSLNRYQTPFHLKAPTAAAGYDRADAAVLYIGARYFSIVARLVSQLRERVPLEDAVPLFTKRLWPGIGVATEPGSGESFGSHRSRLAAEGLIEAWRHGDGGSEARLAAVAERFAVAGLDVARPWLGAGATDQFDLPAPARLP
jgi:hypothetical protein